MNKKIISDTMYKNFDILEKRTNQINLYLIYGASFLLVLIFSNIISLKTHLDSCLIYIFFLSVFSTLFFSLLQLYLSLKISHFLNEYFISILKDDKNEKLSNKITFWSDISKKIEFIQFATVISVFIFILKIFKIIIFTS